MSIDLKPCPFCGDSANVERWDSEVSILCSNCNVRSAPFFAENEATCIAAWNTRAREQPTHSDVALAECLKRTVHLARSYAAGTGSIFEEAMTEAERLADKAIIEGSAITSLIEGGDAQ